MILRCGIINKYKQKFIFIIFIIKMPCKIFPFCKLRNHKNLSDCLIGRDAYYGYNTGQEVVLMCPTCLILCHQNDDKNSFYQLHQLHLGRLSKADKYLFILKAQIKEYKTSSMKLIPLDSSTILKPSMKLNNIDLNEIRDLLMPSMLDNNDQKEFGNSNISSTSVDSEIIRVIDVLHSIDELDSMKYYELNKLSDYMIIMKSMIKDICEYQPNKETLVDSTMKPSSQDGWSPMKYRELLKLVEDYEFFLSTLIKITKRDIDFKQKERNRIKNKMYRDRQRIIHVKPDRIKISSEKYKRYRERKKKAIVI